MNYRIVLYLWLVLFLNSGGIKAQVYTDRKVHSYPVTAKTSVEVSNKYGKIHVIAWEQDSVRFEVDLRISASSIEKLQKLKNNISVDFNDSQYFILAKTNFSNAGNIITDFVETYIPSNQVVINYMIYVPRQINLKIENKFGDIYMDDFGGPLEINLSNGDLKANKISGSPTINISSGDATINNISGGRVLASYSDLHIKQAFNADLETRSSRVTVDVADNLKIDSRRDKIKIVSVDILSSSGYFSTFEIENLMKELRGTLKYGNLMIDNIEKGFSFININSEYTDIDLFFDRYTAYNIDIAHHNDVYINLPASLAKVQTKDLDTEQKLKLTYGKIGNADENSAKLKITAPKKCVINIIHK
jgi:hypothetical protein